MDGDSRIYKLCLSAVAASAAETATFPADLLKTRLQLAGQQAAAGGALRPAKLAATAASIARTEGFLGLYAGLAPAVLRHVPYTGIRVLAFEQLRGLAKQRLLPPQQQHAGAPPPQLPLFVSLAIGLTAGGLGQLVAVPADLIKVRMQADGRLVAAGLQAAPRWEHQRLPQLLLPLWKLLGSASRALPPRLPRHSDSQLGTSSMLRTAIHTQMAPAPPHCLCHCLCLCHTAAGAGTAGCCMPSPPSQRSRG
jgi:hypothetical protein